VTTRAGSIGADAAGDPQLLEELERLKEHEATLAARLETIEGMLDSTGDSVLSVDAAGRYTSFNETHAANMKAQYGVDIRLGGSLLESIRSAAEREAARTSLDRALRGERHVREVVIGEEAGAARYFEIVNEPIRRGDEVVGVGILAYEYTERRHAELELRERERVLSTVMSNVPGMAFRSARARPWIDEFVSAGCEELTGYPPEALVGPD